MRFGLQRAGAARREPIDTAARAEGPGSRVWALRGGLRLIHRRVSIAPRPPLVGLSPGGATRPQRPELSSRPAPNAGRTCVAYYRSDQAASAALRNRAGRPDYS